MFFDKNRPLVFKFLFSTSLLVYSLSAFAMEGPEQTVTADTIESMQPLDKISPKFKINKIIIEGNKYVRKDVISARIPYKIGDAFELEKSSTAINNLYDLGYFHQIQIEYEELDGGLINLFILVEEKKLLEKIEFKGNKAISAKKFKETLNLDHLSTIDKGEIHKIIKSIKKAYIEENKHNVKVS